MKTLVTGGLGFMGSNFVRYLIKDSEEEVVIFDALTYAGRLENIQDIRNRLDVRIQNLRDYDRVAEAVKGCDYICHFGAETHIDRSIKEPKPFIEANVEGTFNLLEAARKFDVEKFVLISSSEIYGTAKKVPMDEEHPINPQSPYAATKAAADRLCYAYNQTYDLPTFIIRAFNNYGPRQFPEKLIPFFTLRALHDMRLPVYGDGKYSRDYVYVVDFCEGVSDARKHGPAGEVVNFATGRDIEVVEIAKRILQHLRKPESLIVHVEDRPGHVRRLVGTYEKARKLMRWEPKTSFETGLGETIDWYLHNEWWWTSLKEQFAGSMQA